MLDIAQFRANIVRPTLEAIGAHNRVAEDLVLATALQESNLRYLRQLNDGPARGVHQMEPPTHDDIWENHLAFRAEPSGRVSAFLAPGQDRVDQLVWNLAYATAMCRVHYLRVPIPATSAPWASTGCGITTRRRAGAPPTNSSRNSKGTSSGPAALRRSPLR